MRCVIVSVDGPDAIWPHIPEWFHSVAAAGSQCNLSLRSQLGGGACLPALLLLLFVASFTSSFPISPPSAASPEAEAAYFAQLVGVYEDCYDSSGAKKDWVAIAEGLLSRRYNGLQPVLVTNSASVDALARAVGFRSHLLGLDDTVADACLSRWTEPLQGAELAVAHVVCPAGSDTSAALALCGAIGRTLAPAQPDVLAVAVAGDSSAPRRSLAAAGGATAVRLGPLPLPLQSYAQRDGRPDARISGEAMAVCASYAPAVTRCDAATRFGPDECRTRGGLGAMLADRLLAEVAFKLGRAPKYGA